MHYSAALLLLMSAVAGTALAQPAIHLKRRQIDTTVEGLRATKDARQSTFSRRHLIVQLTEPPGPQHAEALTERGAVVLGYVHENALMVSIRGELDPGGLPVRWMGLLEPDDKISAELPADPAGQLVIVEFHPDVDAGEARMAILAAGGELADHPDIRGSQLLAVLTAGQVRDLAALDEVAYIFPATDELVTGTPLVGCVLAGNAAAPAQLVAKVGEGWDGPGRGPATLTYTFASLTSQLTAVEATSAITRAWAEWSRVANITFTPASSAGARNVNVVFGRREHGDGYAFDGTGGALAHTFYPSPVTPEPLAGDMHFDEDERWRLGSHTDLFSVALHEAGHALGLGHSDRPGTVMYPYYSQLSGLTDEDTAAIQALYAAPGSGVPSALSLTLSAVAATTTTVSVRLAGSVAGGAAPVVVRWSSDKSGTGAAPANPSFSFDVPLAIGANTIRITATDARNTSVSRSFTITRVASTSSVTIRLTDPGPATTFSTTTASLRFRGTASHPAGIRRVDWSNSRGGSGTASGSATWDIAAVPLLEGLNIIAIQAQATDGTAGVVVIHVTSTRLATRDLTSPLVTVSSPGTVTSFTSAASIIVKGTASDNTGVQSVQWFSGSGASGAANGTTSWATPPIPLYVGVNTIVIRAFDAAGNIGWRSLQVTRLR